jgi:RNA polymerase-binding transcription factor DksA
MNQERISRTSPDEPAVDVEWFRRELCQERQFRLDQLVSLTYEEAMPGPVAVEEVRAALKSGARRALQEIDAALFRLARGAFGTCEVCGASLPVSHLEAIPTTRLCLRCEYRQTTDSVTCGDSDGVQVRCATKRP